MRSGVSFPSFAAEATWSVSTGTWSSAFPVTNLSTLRDIRSVARAAGTGAIGAKFTLPAARAIQFVALVHHNLPPACTVRVQLYAGAAQDGTLLYDSTAVLVWPAGSAPGIFPGVVRPFLLDAPVAARSGIVTIGGEGGATTEIGAIEISGFWEWNDVAVPREVGLNNRDVVVTKPLGYEDAMMQWSPRTVSGSREMVLQTENETTTLDFFRENKTFKPFVWLWDFADPSTWANQAMLVVNSSLPSTNAYSFPAGRISFTFQEHIG